MERLQKIDDAAAELIQPVQAELHLATRQAADAEDQMVTTWSHLIPRTQHAV